MKEELDLSISQSRREESRSQSNHNGERWERTGNGSHTKGGSSRVNPAETVDDHGASMDPGSTPFNLLRLAEILARRWKWVALGMVLTGLGAFLVGLKITSFTAKVALIRRQHPNAFTAGGGEDTVPQAYLSRELSAQTLFVLMRSPEVLRRVSEKAVPPIPPGQLAKAVRVLPERDPDFVTLALSAKAPKESLSKWVNLYADEVITYTQELQADEAGAISEFLGIKLKRIESELSQVNEQLVRFAESAQTLDVDKEIEAYTQQIVGIDAKTDTARLDLETLDFRVKNLQNALHQDTPANDRLQAAQDELDRLRLRFTDLHQAVISQKAIVEALKRQSAAGNSTNTLAHVPTGNFASAVQLQILELNNLKEVRQRELDKYEAIKAKLQGKARGLSKTAVAYAQYKARQKRLEDLRTVIVGKQQEAQLLHENALGYFKVYSYASPSDVNGQKRFFTVTLLGLLGAAFGALCAALLALVAELVDTRVRSRADLQRATRLPVLATLGQLQDMTPEEQVNWAFRTLTLLQGRLNTSSDDTLVCGFISSHYGEGRSTWINLLVGAASQRGMRVLTVATRPSKTKEADTAAVAPKDTALLPVGPATTLTKNVLAFPEQVTEQFSDPQAQPIVHIPLPGWVWSLERRQQWRTAVESWQEIRNLVLLIELPPASQPESVLLAEHLPQVIWLAESGSAQADETRAQLETLRHARCNLVGAVLNREPKSVFKRYFGPLTRRFGLWGAVALNLAWSMSAAAPDEMRQPATNMSFSASNPLKRAPWQERLTLGPGDAFDLSVYGHPELTRTNVVVGPDGKISFMQVQDFPAAGATIDELRARLETELGKYFVGGVRTILIPTAFNSKKYFLLGKVVTEGAFVLDRPVTIIEAVARAKGLKAGPAEMTDLRKSFIIRQGKRLGIDLERLFQEGDLSQNIPLEPNDYLYFAPATAQELYVLGEVLSPGIVRLSSDPSVLGAISARGGFTPRAYRKRVLVIRGSLDRPQAFAIDAPAMLAARIPDFKLQARDIVYVNARPWIRVEELLDIAAQAFIEAAITEWSGANVPAVFTRPIFPNL